MRSAALIVAFAALALTGCSVQAMPDSSEPDPEPAEVEVSAACRESLVTLEEVEPGNFEAEDAAIQASTIACTTVDEYIAGVKENPGSWFYTGPEFVDVETTVIAACIVDATTPMCLDAESLGYDVDRN